MKVRLVTEADSTGGKLPPGTEIDHPEAWLHCLPGFLNARPIAEPADDEATAKVAAEMQKRNARLGAVQAIVRRPGEKPEDKAMTRQFATAYESEIMEKR
jgi:hypothetical protein